MVRGATKVGTIQFAIFEKGYYSRDIFYRGYVFSFFLLQMQIFTLIVCVDVLLNIPLYLKFSSWSSILFYYSWSSVLFSDEVNDEAPKSAVKVKGGRKAACHGNLAT